MTDLLPCPFCGSTNLRHEFSGSQGYICCNECGTEGPCDERAADPICDMDAAYAAWNRRAALADGPAVSDDSEPASVDDSLALRVQRLEAMRETEKAALLDAFRQIDDLKHRIDFQYWKIHQLEEATDTTAPETDDRLPS